MNKESNIQGHISAFITIIIWGSTFISTKVLLKSFIPIEILFYRFLIGFIILSLVSFKRIKIDKLKNEVLFIGAGFTGIMLYYLLENIALIYTSASNVGVIISVAPFFTAIFSAVFLKEDKLKLNFFIGFIIAISGIYIMSFNGNKVFNISPFGDILALCASIVWAVYSILTKKISALGYNNIEATKKIFLYGLVFMIPLLPLFKFKFGLNRFINITNTFNIFFLGLCASAICFVTWNKAVRILGPVRTSVYIYMVPVITVVTSVIILKEKITIAEIFSIMLILLGLFLSEGKSKLKN